MRKSIVALIFSLSLLLLGHRKALAQTAAADPPRVHALTWKSQGEWQGYSLERQRIVSAYVSDEIRSDNRAFRGEVVQLRIAGPTREWDVRCTHWVNPVSSVCDFIPNDGTTASTFVSSDGKVGWLSGQADVRLEIEDLVSVGSFSAERSHFTGSFYNSQNSKIASWEYDLGRSAFELHTFSITDAEQELAALMLLALQPASMGSDMHSRLDSYLLVARPPAEDRGQAAIADWFEQQGNQASADLLRAHVRDTRRIDVQAGAYAARHPWTPRVYMSLSGGPSVLPHPSGAAAGIGGASVTASGGVKFNYVLVGAFVSLRPGEVDNASFSQLAGNQRLRSSGVAVGAEARYLVPILDNFGAALGLAAAWRLRSIDAVDRNDSQLAVQSGFSLAPIAELHFAVWNPNKLGSRLLLTVDAMPEVQFWGKPKSDIPGRLTETFIQALNGTDLALRTSLGLRFEL